MSAAEWRWLFTYWLAKAWKDYATHAFKRCGQFNDVHGRENHLIKIQGVPDYKSPAKDDPWLVDPLKEGKRSGKSLNRSGHRKSRKLLDFECFSVISFEKLKSFLAVF